jgi:glyoxylase-like metal-dependent hydrolase (beta-lactamase superfamily II)
MRSTLHRLALASSGALLLAAAATLARQDFQDVAVDLHPLKGPVSWLSGAGGNIGVSIGPDGILMIDDQFAPLAPKIEAVLAAHGQGAPRFVINTHWHGDHTGGNAAFGERGTLMAHANVRARLRDDPKAEHPAAALPLITYADGLSLWFNGEEVRVLHVPHAHTDGDSVVWFTGTNVVHMGDLYFQVGYPFIDLASGGDVKGYVAGVRAVLAQVPKDALFIAGHGQPTLREGVEEYVAMLEDMIARVQQALAQEKTADEIAKSDLGAKHDARWGHFSFMPREKFLGILCQGLGSAR